MSGRLRLTARIVSAVSRSIRGVRLSPRALALGLLLTALAPSACEGGTPLAGVTGVDVSPDTANGVLCSSVAQTTSACASASTAGLTFRLAGAEDTLYAVSLDAGVWRSDHGGPWAQLPETFAQAYSIAVDPNDVHHIAVGERDGDGAVPSKNTSGVYQSYDRGDHFPEYFDPMTNGGCNGSQAIPSLTFTQQGSVLVAATACGVAVQAGKGQPWIFPSTPIGPSLVTAVVASETKVWARDAQGTLIVSADSGKTWYLATQHPLPSGTTLLPGGDAYSLAAFDDYAYMSIRGDDNGNGNNYNALLIYDAKNDRWVIQKRIGDPQDSGASLNGTGLGASDGHRFVRAFKINPVEGPPIPVVIFGDGQDVLMSTGQDTSTGLLTWKRIASTNYACDPMTGICYPPKDPSFQPLLHDDVWDVLESPGGTLWLSGDGGVFENDQDGKGWLERNQGLHTQHVHMLYAAPLGTAYAYPTTDNDAWFKGFSGDWQHDDVGDSNWVVGDLYTHPLFAYFARNPSSSTLAGFDAKVPDNDPGANINSVNGAVGSPQRSADTSFDGPLTFSAIQTLPREPKPPSQFDAVMLAKMPLQYKDANGNAITVIDDGQSLAIVRNRYWVNHPDINDAKGQGWELMADHLPSMTVGFVVANGHEHPALYVLAGPPGSIDLYRWDGSVHGTWTKLPINGDGQPSQLLMGGEKGPVFVNPYDAKYIYALTAAGIRYSTDGGDTWITDSELTNALTDNQQYPLTGTYGGGNGTNVEVGSHAVALGTLSDMAFELGLPQDVVAASPFTGVFYNKGDGKWISLREGLPSVLTPVSSVAIFGNVVVVGMEGRGLWQIRNIDSADSNPQ